ncbi:hypothetical protein OA405_03185, partial [Bacteroidota bacterium]|nr:hypothetical protein [Bacteroidota bacterium]
MQTATVCLDLSSATGGVIMDFDYLTESGFGNTSNVNGSAYSTFRVKVNGTVVQDISGVQWHGLETLTNLSYDLSSYAGQSSVYVTWEAACKYSAGYSLGTYGDYVWIDNINVNSGAIFGCTDTLATNYDSLATNNNGSCIYPCYVAPWSSSFEDGIASIAITPDDWTNTSNPGWLRNTIPFGGTPSSSTGPLSAHDGGYFLFTEASGAVAGSERTLVSHCMDISSLVQPEFSMRIHMFGQSMGSMYLFGSGDAGSTWDTLWSATGQQQTAQSDPWIEVTADLSAYSSTGVTMKITGYMGTSFWSDMAIDYTQVYDANIVTGCTDSTASNYDPLAVVDDGSCVYPGCTAAPYYENFDAGMGSFTTANTGTGTYPGWLMGTSTPSFGTGPTGDVTGGSFMYIETSGLGGPYTLTSECLDITTLTAPALRFHYHMYGATMGTLDVSVNGTSVWTMSGDQGNTWHPAQVDLAAYATSDSIVVVFTGTRGTSFTGDMAIDAIEVDEFVNLTIPGCTDTLALNYNPMANSDDGSCNYHCANTSAYGSATANPIDTVTISTCNYLTEYSTISGVGAGESYTATISGPNANPGYIVVYEGGSATNFVAQGSAPLTWTSTVAGTYYIHWFVDSLCNTATGCHTTTLIGNNAVAVPGCTDPTALNYDPLATIDDGSCIAIVYGCTDSTAINYFPGANVDDGSCCLLAGCTDSTASN